MSEFEQAINSKRLRKSITANLGRWGVFPMRSESEFADASREVVQLGWPNNQTVELLCSKTGLAWSNTSSN